MTTDHELGRSEVLPAHGAVTGAPRRWLRMEAAVVLVGSLVAFSTTGEQWWLVPALLFLPDLLMVGYLGGTRLGAHLYNLAHALPLPALVVGLGWWQDRPLPLALGLVWLAHIGMDRVLGYGLKYDDHFQHTHLGWLGGSPTGHPAPAFGPDGPEAGAGRSHSVVRRR